MSEHHASVQWQRSGEFTSETYSLHHRAHEKCFIANSVKSEVIVEPC